jgi:hypothetical protein
MQKKYGKFYADFKDEKGHRRRKAFKTKEAATAFQTKMRNAIKAKKASGHASRRSARLTQKQRRATRTQQSSHAKSVSYSAS